MWTDSHCHVQGGDDPDATLKRAWDAGVASVVCIGTDVEDSRRAIALAARYASPGAAAALVADAGDDGRPRRSRGLSFRRRGEARGEDSSGEQEAAPPAGGRAAVFATVGLHPHEASAGVGGLAELLEEELGEGPANGAGAAGEASPQQPATARPIVVAVGECGLDYHYEHSPRTAQQDAFAAQVALARRHGLALVVHTREAWKDTFAVLAAEGVPDRMIFHCFSGDAADAERCVDAGGYLSFSGIITFKNADDLRAAAALCPADRLLVETDSPFLTPVPHRGRPNEPMYTPLVGEAVAVARERPVEEIAELTSANAARVFGLPAPA